MRDLALAPLIGVDGGWVIPLIGWCGGGSPLEGNAKLEDDLGEEETAPSQAPETSFQWELKNEKGDGQADAERCAVTGFEVSAQGFELCFSPILVLNSVPEVGGELEREDRADRDYNNAEKQIGAEQA